MDKYEYLFGKEFLDAMEKLKDPDADRLIKEAIGRLDTHPQRNELAVSSSIFQRISGFLQIHRRDITKSIS